MNREHRLDVVLRHLMSGGGVEPALPATDDAFDRGLESLLHFWAARYEQCADSAAAALDGADDADALALARAVAGLAVSGWAPGFDDARLTTDRRTGGDPLGAALADAGELSTAMAPALRGLLAEGALSCARVSLAVDLIERAGPPPASLFGVRHPFLTFLHVLSARVAAFHGDIDGAQPHVDAALQVAHGPVESMLAIGCSALVRGNADERTGTRALLRRIDDAPPPRDAVTRGCHVLAAYGAVALGDVERGSRLVLEAGGDADLSQLRLIDRAIGFELLVAAAIASDDLDSAQAWLSRLAPLATHPVTSPTFDRAHSRTLLLARDARGAVAAAERAIASARAEGRAIEAAEGEVVLARARIAADQRGEAARGLATVVSEARTRGHLAIQRAAARELRQVGRRLPPIEASGWEGLSPREREVAVLVAEGHGNASLASELFLSEHTVRIHVSRVLQAFGVATRSGVAAALSPALRATGTDEDRPLASLTERQEAVVELLILGSSNRSIADALGISEATVQKHVSAVMRRWGATSRSGIVALAGRARDDA